MKNEGLTLISFNFSNFSSKAEIETDIANLKVVIEEILKSIGKKWNLVRNTELTFEMFKADISEFLDMLQKRLRHS